MKKLNNLLIASFCTLLVFALVSGCSKGTGPINPITPDPEKVVGLTLYHNGSVGIDK